MAIQYTPHGGRCCGYAHVYDFDHGTIAELDRVLEGHFTPGNPNRVLEAILTDRQLAPTDGDSRVLPEIRDAGGWAAILAERGFSKGVSWRNSNTGRNCHQFLKIPETLEGGLAFDWTGPLRHLTPPPPVETIQREAVPEVGWRVRRIADGGLGTVRRVDEANVSVSLDDGRTDRLSIRNFNRGYRRIIEVNGIQGGLVNAPVDPDRTVYARLLNPDGTPTNRIYPAQREAGRRYRLVIPEGEDRYNGRAWNLTQTWTYNTATGLFGAGNHVRLFNVEPIHAEPEVVVRLEAAPRPQPVEAVSVEYYASLRVGRRGPFETLEAAREAFPRCRRFERRQIMSDGTSTWETV